MPRVIKTTEKDIDKIVRLIDNRIEAIRLAQEKYMYDCDFERTYEKYKNELDELKNIREKLRHLDVKLIIHKGGK